MTDAGTLPVPSSPATPGLEPFTTGLQAGELRLPFDRASGDVVWYPRTADARGPIELDWRPSSGRGSVYSFTVMHRPVGSYRDAAPHVLAYVELDEGPRLLSQLIGVRPADVVVGMRVRAVIERAPADPEGPEDAVILRFTPDDGD